MRKSLSNFLYAGFFACLTVCIAPVSFAEPQNLTDLKQELIRYHDSGQYEQEIGQTINQAKEYLQKEVDYYKANEPEKKLAIVFDIDETSLSNYNNMIKLDFSGQKDQLHQYVLKADAPAIKETHSLYQGALEQGVYVFFVTGRRSSERQATKANLIKAGFNQWSGLYTRPENDTSHSIVPFKSRTREVIEQKGYVVLLNVGDQDTDLQGGHAKKGFKLPNPFYKLP